MKNRRRHVRLNFAIEVWLGQGGVLTRTNDRLRNLSIGGAHIDSEQSYPPESVLNLRFKLPHASDFITCTAAVRHTNGRRRLGVEFLDLSADDRYRIKSFIEHQLIAEALQRARRLMFQAVTPPEQETAQQSMAGGKRIGEAGK